jgi:integrase/recombinase XerD
MSEVRWERYPLVGQSQHARSWLRIQADLQRAPSTVEAYGRALEEYLVFCDERGVVITQAGREHVAAYVRHLAERPNPRGARVRVLD